MKKLSNWLNKINEIVWLRIFKHIELNARSISIFRIIFGLFLLFFNTPTYGWIREAPETFFNPPIISIAFLFNHFPPDSTLLLFDLAVIISLLCITIGIKARVFTIVFFIINILGDSFLYSFGKIDHEILLTALVGCMVFSGWGRYYAVWPDKALRIDSADKSLALLAVFICFGMFTAGSLKALRWIDFDFSTGGFLSWYYRGFFTLDRTFLLAPTIQYIPVWLFEFADYLAVIFELSPFILLLKSRKSWLWWLFFACGFHLINTFILNISFHFHFVVYLAFVDFQRLSLYFVRKFSLTFNWDMTIRVLNWGTLTIAAVHIYLIILQKNSQFLFISQYYLEREIKLYVAVALWLIAIGIIFSELNLLQSGFNHKYQILETPKQS